LAPILCLPCSVLVPQTSAIPGNTTTSPGTLESGRELGKRTFLLVMGLPGSSLTTQGSAVRTRHRPRNKHLGQGMFSVIWRGANVRSAHREIQQKSNTRSGFVGFVVSSESVIGQIQQIQHREHPNRSNVRGSSKQSRVRRFEPWAGFVPEGNAHDLGFRALSWLSREVLSFRGRRGRARSVWVCD
jgi:hypothetical protein